MPGRGGGRASLEAACAAIAATCACTTVRLASRAITQLYDSALAPSGLRVTQFVVLVGVLRGAGMTLNRLAKTLGMERSTLPRNLRPLIRRRLVEVMSGPDKRAKVIRLTKAGERQVARMIPHWERAQARVLRDIGIRKWRSLGADLRLLAKSVGPAPTRKARERPPHPG